MPSIILIGMPGAGKSTTGVILAKAAWLAFCDTDLLIQKAEGAVLQNIIDSKGADYFLQCEARHILENQFENMVVATGGSVVYSRAAMKHLKKFGPVVYLDVPVEELSHRVGDFAARGVIGTGTIEEIYALREQLYRRYADIVLDCSRLRMEQTVAKIIAEVLKA